MRRVPPISAVGLLLTGIITASASAELAGTERYEADLAASRVTVTGTSTLHAWHVEGRHLGGSLSIDGHELASLWRVSSSSPHTLAPTVRVEIPVTSLAGGTREMDEKMHEALKAKTHPTMTYRLESVTIPARQTAHTDDTGGSVTIDTTGVLVVAGAERTVNMPMRVRWLSDHRLEISGDTSLRMTEFGIDPPRAMLGMLRTGDEVHVHWTWVLARRPS